MGAADIRLRMATQDDAQTVASIITTVSEGVIEYLLGDLFPGMTPEKILEMILIRGSGNLNLSNVLLVDVGGELAGLLFAYDAKEQTVSGMMEGFLGEARVKPMRPLLEAKVEKALWINTLWVNESFRGKGLSKLLMDVAGCTPREAFGCGRAMGKGAVGEKRGEGVKIVAISGATGGIGRALARAYAKPGVMLLLAGRRLDVLTDTKAFCERLGAKVEIDAYDVRDEAATVRWCRKAAALGAVRLILAAGVSASVRNHADEAAYYLPERMDDLKRELDVNAVANILACNAFVRAVMQSNTNGRSKVHVQVAIVASLAALTGLPGSPGYSASKAALRVFGEAIRRLTKDRNIGITVLCPGFIESDMSRPWLMNADEGARKMKAAIESEKAEYAFPRILAFGIGLLNLLPRCLQPLFLKGFFFTVKPDHESASTKW